MVASSYGIPPVEGRSHPIVVWEVKEGRQRARTLSGHKREVLSLDFSPDGRHLASGGWDHHVRLWNVVEGKEIPPALLGHDTGVRYVAFAPDGEMLASIDTDSLRLWDVRTGKNLLTRLERGLGPLAFSHSGDRLAVVSHEQKNILTLAVDAASWQRVACRLAPPLLDASQLRYYFGGQLTAEKVRADPCDKILRRSVSTSPGRTGS
jgi:WD40 repeat protein